MLQVELAVHPEMPNQVRHDNVIVNSIGLSVVIVRLLLE